MIFIHCHPETHLSVLSYESAFLLHCHQVYCTRITPVFTMRYNKEYLRLKTETNLACYSKHVELKYAEETNTLLWIVVSFSHHTVTTCVWPPDPSSRP